MHGRGTRYAVDVRPVVGHPGVRVMPERAFSTRTRGSARSSSSNSPPQVRPPATTRASSRSAAAARPTRSRTSCASEDPQVIKDVLLIDWDRNLGGVDHRQAYTDALTGLGLSHDVYDAGLSARRRTATPGPTYAQLQGYRAIVLFTGDNTTSWSTAHVGGSFPVQDYLVAGGRLIMSGPGPQHAVPLQPEHRQRLPVRPHVGLADGPARTQPGDLRGHAQRRELLRRTGPRRRHSSRRRSRCSDAVATSA